MEVSWGCPNDKYPLNGLFQFDQAKALREAGLDVVFAALDLRSVRRWRKWGINHTERDDIQVYEYNFPCGPMPPNIKYQVQDHAFRKIIRTIEHKYGKPVVIHVHTCQQAISVTHYCTNNNIPYIITEHITPLDEGDTIEVRKKQALLGAKKVIAVSNALGKDIKREYGVDSVTIPNIVDLSEFAYIPKEEETKKNVRILSAASVNHGKGFDILLQAYALVLQKYPYCHLTIMGDGPEMSNIQALASKLGLTGMQQESKITFTGSYIRRDFAYALSQSDYFVLASRSETFGIVYAEALASGIPVIATECGGPEDFIDASNGLLVETDDINALADAMIYMSEHFNDYDRAGISLNAKNRFSSQSIAEQIAKWFN